MESGPSVRILGMHVRLLREQVCNDWQMSVEGRLVQRGLAYDASTEYSRYRNSSSTRPYLALLVLNVGDRAALLHDCMEQKQTPRSEQAREKHEEKGEETHAT